jgi:hypothetical protein
MSPSARLEQAERAYLALPETMRRIELVEWADLK